MKQRRRGEHAIHRLASSGQARFLVDPHVAAPIRPGRQAQVVAPPRPANYNARRFAMSSADRAVPARAILRHDQMA